MFDAAGDGISGVVLGIDPGVSRCGYGAVARDGASLTAVACGVIRTAPTDPLPTRLAMLAGELQALIGETKPRAMAVERVLFQVNARTAMSVGQASGLALMVAGRAGVPVAHYSPNEVKLAVAGDGAAGKKEVQQMVTRLLRLREIPRPADAADALALAICHWWRAPLERAIAHEVGDGSRLESAIQAALEHERASRAGYPGEQRTGLELAPGGAAGAAAQSGQRERASRAGYPGEQRAGLEQPGGAAAESGQKEIAR